MTSNDPAEAGRAALAAWRDDLGTDPFHADPLLPSLLDRLLGRDPARDARLEAVASSAGEELDRPVTEANRDENLPQVRRHDRFGRPLEEVAFHPDHHRVGRVFWGSGVLAALATPGSEVLAGAIAYLLDRHGEAGHACPVACTAGAIKLLQRLGTDEQKERWLPRLLETDYDRRIHAAQFVTEVQGGSDVGANSCVAVPDPDRPGAWRISGEKWFCSVADAGLLVVSARVEGAPEGTRGLGLFLVPRTLDGRPNGFALRRLKWKLGTRSMPTGEFEFDRALAEPIGPLEHGFRNLVGIVLDTSRVHNAIAACGIMRRALDEAGGYARRREAFGRPILAYPAVQETVAAMRLRLAAGLASTFRVLRLSDLIDTGGGDPDLVAARRIAVMVNKYWTSIAATASARDGIEVLGGNGTIEDFSCLPRLYRDAIVIESWEGTHNTLCAQVLRDAATRGLHRPWLELLRREVEALDDAGVAGEATTARALVDDVEGRLERLVGVEPAVAAAWMRHTVDRMARTTDWVALATHLQWQLRQGLGEDTRALMELYRLRRLERATPDDRPEMIDLHRRLATGR